VLLALNYYAVFLYGLFITLFLLNIKCNQTSTIAISAYSVVSGIVILAFFYLFGVKFIAYAYPFIIHLPLVLFLRQFFKKPTVAILFAVGTAYMLTTPRKWLGESASYFFHHDPNLSLLFQIIVSIPLLILVYKFIRPAIIKIIEYSGMKILILTFIPITYYFFAYTTTVYTDLLYRSNIVIVGFLASCIIYVFYAFLVTYFNEITKSMTLQNEHNFYKMQVEETNLQLQQFRDLQKKSAIYRHDLRHHLSLLDSLIEKGRIEESRAYIATINHDIESIAAKRHCENEIINIVLSLFIAKAEEKQIMVVSDIAIPSVIDIDPSDACVVLANGIENSIHAIDSISDPQKRKINIYCHIKNGKLFIEIINHFDGNIIFENNIPQNYEENHGLGTKSIVAACEKYQGIYSFEAENNIFTLRVVL